MKQILLARAGSKYHSVAAAYGKIRPSLPPPPPPLACDGEDISSVSVSCFALAAYGMMCCLHVLHNIQ